MKIYFAHSTDIDFINDFYNPIKQFEKLKNHDLIFPHEMDTKKCNPRDFYKSIDLMIAEVSFPSTGLGIELGWASDDNVNLCCVYKKGSKISSALKPITNNIFEYSSLEQMLEIIYNNIVR